MSDFSEQLDRLIQRQSVVPRLGTVMLGLDGIVDRTGSGAKPVDHRVAVGLGSARVTFWGTQGSVPVAPDSTATTDYQGFVAEHALRAVLEQFKRDGGAELRRLAGMGEKELEEGLEQVLRGVATPCLPTYGGETTCVTVETDEGNFLIFDGGTGLRRCAGDLDRRWVGRKDRTVHVFFTHEHLDHRNGLPFCRLCYARPETFELRLYGTRQLLAALDDRYGIFTRRLSETMHFDDPVDYRAMSASFHAKQYRDPKDNRPVPWETMATSDEVRVGSTKVTAFELYHGTARCLGYRVEHKGKVFVLATDHELRHPNPKAPPATAVQQEMQAEVQAKSEAAEARVRANSQGADLAYFDAQYLMPEYFGERGIGNAAPASRVDWGHGTIEDAIERATSCGVKRTYLGHHEPERPWWQRRAIDTLLAAKHAAGGPDVRMANDEEAVEV
jgi:ribonuclease BN (tRNA processing enzyme)